MKKSIRIGCGAGFSGDRLEPAVVLAEHGQLDFLVLECLAERTIALAQKRRLQDPSAGYDPLLERRITGLLPFLVKNNITLLSNMGAANPLAGGQKIAEIARKMGFFLKIAVVTGDDVLSVIAPDTPAIETGRPLREAGPLLSANAYLGVEAILPALETGANIILTGRVADPSLFLAPMIHAFGWRENDWDMMGKGTVVGHLLECAGQVTGGYFADPVKKPVPGLDCLGHPFADVFPDGSAVISKVAGTGGVVNLQTTKEQLLYEVVDPHAYLTPDVAADFTTVFLAETGPDQVRVTGGTGRPRPETLKVSAGYKAFFLGEGEISYAGASARARAELAADAVRKCLAADFPDLRVDYIGVQSVHRTDFGQAGEPYEVRLRIAGKAATPEQAALVGEAVEALYTNGPAGGGGARKFVTEVIGIQSVLLNRNQIKPGVTIFES